jgi:hypothetical protein
MPFGLKSSSLGFEDFLFYNHPTHITVQKKFAKNGNNIKKCINFALAITDST